MHLIDEVNNLTQVERDHVIEWLRVNRPSELRNALRHLGYLTSPARPQGRATATPGPHWIRSHHAKCLDPPEGCGEYTSQYDGKGPAVIWHKPGCPVEAAKDTNVVIITEETGEQDDPIEITGVVIFSDAKSALDWAGSKPYQEGTKYTVTRPIEQY